jgi:hypothetical protein
LSTSLGIEALSSKEKVKFWLDDKGVLFAKTPNFENAIFSDAKLSGTIQILSAENETLNTDSPLLVMDTKTPGGLFSSYNKTVEFKPFS